MKKVLILGVTGLVGSHLVQQLVDCSDIGQVVALGRSASAFSHPKFSYHIVDFKDGQSYEAFFEVDTVFCCLGSTLKQAGSKAAARAVDVDLVLQLAQKAKQKQVTQFLVISSLGAGSQKSNFYLKNKGDMEKGLEALHFPVLHILRPSLLLGQRSDSRLGETLGEWALNSISFLLTRSWKKYRPITASDVAQAMVKMAATSQASHIWESDEIQAIADKK